jgi:hypothetical protein
MLLNLIDRPGDAIAALRRLLTDNHDDEETTARHLEQAMAIYDELLAAGVVEELDAPDADGRTVRLTEDLQLNFALNQPLSPFAVTALDLLDRESETYALDALSVIEAILEDPRQVLSRADVQGEGRGGGAMKAEGIEYDERMELLESRSPTRSRWQSCSKPASRSTGSPTRGCPPRTCRRSQWPVSCTSAR